LPTQPPDRPPTATPQRHRPVRAHNEAGESIEEPSGAEINDMVTALVPDNNSFLIVEHTGAASNEQYIQTLIEPDLGWQVEYRDGDADHHFGASLPPGSDAEVAAVIRHWVADDATWRTALPWELMTFPDED
jgi:hypothetical protein